MDCCKSFREFLMSFSSFLPPSYESYTFPNFPAVRSQTVWDATPLAFLRPRRQAKNGWKGKVVEGGRWQRKRGRKTRIPDYPLSLCLVFFFPFPFTEHLILSFWPTSISSIVNRTRSWEILQWSQEIQYRKDELIQVLKEPGGGGKIRVAKLLLRSNQFKSFSLTQSRLICSEPLRNELFSHLHSMRPTLKKHMS